MDKVTVDLSFCYGIKRLNHSFDFATQRAYAIYAPNGVMKSSLALTFEDIVEGRPTTDRIFQGRSSSRSVKNESGQELGAADVLVVHPYSERLGPSERTATLLLHARLRGEWEQLHRDIDLARASLLAAVKRQAKSKRDFGDEISLVFMGEARRTDDALTRIKTELEDQAEMPLANLEYDKIFDEKVMETLRENRNIQEGILEYANRYNELLDASLFFKKGTFDYYNAGQIASSLTRNGFFKASHTVRLNSGGEYVEISTLKDLEGVISREKDNILSDAALKKKFESLSKLLEANAAMRDFRDYIIDNEACLSRLTTIASFKQDVIKSYLKANYDAYLDLMEKLEAARSRKRHLQEEAARQSTQWDEVIEIFNSRFVVPFTLTAKNKIAVMLGTDQMPQLGFTYQDGNEVIEIEEKPLRERLSTGEKKALYVLNVIFEVETRKKARQETLMVIDDLADSFDYQNKYAIIQYLKEISEDGLFKQVIMTHNFDFFRTIQSRFVAGYKQCLMVSKTHSSGITLIEAAGIQNVFVNDWKGKFYADSKKKIACVPFLRNLIEYTIGDHDPNYLKLTSILHWKPDTATITVGDLDAVYLAVCHTAGQSAQPLTLVADLIATQADECLQSAIGTNFENKIVLATAIRLQAEQFITRKLNDPTFIAGLKKNQSWPMVQKFKAQFPTDRTSANILDRVLLMTPENLHLNSFMYEPIVDMSDDALKRLYRDVKGLQ